MSLGLAISLGFAVLIIAFLAYKLISTNRFLKKVKENFDVVNAELTKVIAREHEQNIELLELKNQMDSSLAKDKLTGLVSRQIFEDRLHQVISQSKRHQLVFAILCLNIDGFKIINDALGVDDGDLLLREAAQRLESSIRQLDTVSRFGGDEFVFILPQLAKPEIASYVARRLLDTLAKPFIIKEQEIFITASIGIAVFPNDAEDPKLLVKFADNALHQAKLQGHNSYQFYRKDMFILSQRELILSSGLHSQTVYQQLLLFYQPIVDVETKKITSIEAVLRWKHPEFGLINYEEFLKLAENSRTINPIGEWLLRNACQQFSAWKSLGFFVKTISIKVSGHQLENPHFVYNLTQIMKELNINPQNLILEISEMILQTKLNISEKTLLLLKETGLQICINDFGKGNIGLYHLQNMPVNYFKIASEVIKNITLNPDAVAVIKMMMGIATTLKAQIIATGIESLKQAQLLKSLGCHIMQGDFFSPPILPQEFTMLVEKSIIESDL